jgi:hypothetical protein
MDFPTGLVDDEVIFHLRNVAFQRREGRPGYHLIMKERRPFEF